MRDSYSRAAATLALLGIIFAANSQAIGGTTGTLNGTVLTETSTPIAGATVTAASPSQVATTVSDAAGKFRFLSLAPDTYTLQVKKAAFETVTLTGLTIFADQVQGGIIVHLRTALKTIASVSARSSMDVVRSGTTTDVYSVNATVTKAAQGIGGGGNLTNAYSAIATVPGAFVPPMQQGWAQIVYIRGGNYDQIGYEFDGVPVNRSFDNYPGGTAGTLGQQELQVYTGGGSSNENTTGLAGFINQVIKTGTFPGYANVNAGIGSPTYYHNLQVEAGGASPNREFSYYAGIGGYNQDYRYLDQFNGASLGNVWGYPVIGDNMSNLLNFPGVYPTCISSNTTPFAAPVTDPFSLQPGQTGAIALPAGTFADPGCFGTISPAYSSYSNIADRESVANFHFAIPHKHDGGRDDVQLLFNTTTMLSQYYSSPNDIGPTIVPDLNYVLTGTATPEIWGDFATWPANTPFGSSANNTSAIAYFQPSSPGNRCANTAPSTITDTNGYDSAGTTVNVSEACAPGTYSQVGAGTRDGFWNNASIIKLQYQHNMGTNAYFRIYGYSFYSDWLQNGPLSYATNLFGLGVLSYDYELNSHTRGAAFSFADQINAKNLISLDANYTTATTNRYNNTNFNNGLTTDATNLTNGTHCFAFMPGTVSGVNYNAGQIAPCNSDLTSGTYGDPTRAIQCSENAMFAPGSPNIPAGQSPDPQCPATPPAGASWQVTSTGESGFENTVRPNFTTVALQDRWQPNDKLNVDVGLRFANYQFQLANTQDPGTNFWFSAGQQEFCYNPLNLQPVVIPEPPASDLPANPFIGFNCPKDPTSGVQTVHPDGLNGHLLLSNTYSPTLTDTALTPRLGLTYTANPDTVLRFSAGLYTQEPQNYQVQYGAKDANLAYDLFQAWWQYGFTTPLHDPQVQYSQNYDFSYERRFKGTDMSMKVTPYYRYATNQLYNISLPFGLGGALNTGIEEAKGVELEFTKGDFDRNGLSFLFSYTYLNSQERFENYPGTSINPIDPYNQDIRNFNVLTKAGGGAPCYANDGNATPDFSCAATSIANPYYNMSPQPLYDRNAWYPVGLDYPYLSPHTITAIINYKHDRFAVTPALTFNAGAQYGNPADVAGIDPRTCTSNSAGFVNSAISTTNPLQADYTSCGLADTQGGTSETFAGGAGAGTLYIPDPQTGHFDGFGAFRQPSQLNLSLNLSYDVTPRIKANVLLANLVNACFGGTKEPWTNAFPPNSYTCGYIANQYYVSNFYNGTSPHDLGANGVPLNPAFANAFIPAYADTNALTLPVPFNAYFQIQVKL